MSVLTACGPVNRDSDRSVKGITINEYGGGFTDSKVKDVRPTGPNWKNKTNPFTA